MNALYYGDNLGVLRQHLAAGRTFATTILSSLTGLWNLPDARPALKGWAIFGDQFADPALENSPAL